MIMYKIVRMYFKGGTGTIQRRTVQTGLTVEEAQAHCRDPETSSSTCTSYVGRQRTKKVGEWFDAYEEQEEQ